MDMIQSGHRAALVYCVARTDATAVRPAREIDPIYADTRRMAIDQGLEVYALRLEFDLPRMELVERLKVLTQ